MAEQFDADLTKHTDLRGGTSPWQPRGRQPVRLATTQDIACDIIVVGAGITGSMVAEHLTAMGRDVCIVDRETPGMGSTAASTAMLQWEIDKPLRELSVLYGFDRAAAIYRRSQAAAVGLRDLVAALDLQCHMRDRSSLYLAAAETSAKDLLLEHELRKRAGLPGVYLDYRALLSEFEMVREAAILSSGSSEADPLLLSRGLLNFAVSKGARAFEGQVVEFHEDSRGATVVLDNEHVVTGQHVILATGYVLPDFVQTDLHDIASSWAIATAPEPARLWRDSVLIWEASEDYCYLRTTTDGRIIIGGEDDTAMIEPSVRDQQIPAKAKKLTQRLSALYPRAETAIDFAWAGAFGKSVDGLPLIGTVPGRTRTHAAYGYGGNGITFSYLASRIIGAIVNNHREAWFDDFAFDRDAPARI